MGARRNAYAIFTETFPPEDEPAAIGNGGYVSGNTAAFWRGPYYVKVLALIDTDVEELVRKAARAAADWIRDDSTTLAQFEAFPPDGLIEGTLAFAKSSAFGLDYFRETFMAEYEVDGDGYSLFFCELASPVDAAALIKAHAEFLGVGTAQDAMPDELWGEVKYVGPMFLTVQDNLVAGCVGIEDRAAAEAKTKDLMERVRTAVRKEADHGG